MLGQGCENVEDFRGGLGAGNAHHMLAHALELAHQGHVVAVPGHDAEAVDQGAVDEAGEIAGHDAVEGRQKEIAEALACQLSLREPVVHQLGHQRLGIGQRLQTVADISRRKHPQVLPQSPGAASVIGHRDNGRDILRITLQATQQGGQARAAADPICGRQHSEHGFIGSSCIRVFDQNAAVSGLSEKAAKAAGIPCDSVLIFPNDKVSLMPECHYMAFKLIFEVPTGRILGAQAIGGGECDNRINVIAAMITMHASLEDLKELELEITKGLAELEEMV